MSGKVTLTKAQRRAGVERVGEDLALVSGAGCGKTFVLARRFTELLLRSDSETPLADFVALTFTEKAALEMSQRVARMLGDFAAEADGPQRRRLRDWAQQLPEARISTIHSFCASILRGWAVEAGVDPDFAVCDEEAVTTQMAEEAVEQALLNAAEAGRQDAAELLAELPFARAAEQVAWLLGHRGTVRFEDYFDPSAVLEAWRRQFQAARKQARKELTGGPIAAQLDEIASLRCAAAGDSLLAYRDAQVAAIREILSGHWQAAAFERLNAKPGAIGAAKAWGGREQVKAVRDRIKALVEDVQAYAVFAEDLADLDAQAAAALAALARLAAEAQTLYAAEKRRRGLMDFDDLLVRTAELLERREDVRAAVAKTIRQLLIDEAQDTDGLQVSMLERLMFGRSGASDFGGGRLFVVGDAKQSIYRFRGAQVEVFEDLCRRLGDRREELNLSFRTHKAGVEFVNHLFGPLMRDRYGALDADRKELPDGPSVEILLAAGGEDGPVDSAGRASRAQAALTAQRIREMIDGGEKRVWDEAAKAWRAVRAGDVAILFTRMTVSLDYERELAARGVPYYVVAGTGFFQQQEVFDVLNGLRAIDNPLDDIALLGALRGSLFGLDDNTLMHVAECCEAPYFRSIPKADLSGRLDEDRRATLRFAMDLLGGLHRRKDALAIDELIQELLDATGYEAGLPASPYGRRMLGNVRMLLDRARGIEAGAMGLAEFITQMDRQILREERSEQAATAGEREDVVRLMTIHKAKGLEFPVVFVPDLNSGRRGSHDDLLARSDWGLTCRLRGRDDDGERRLPLSYRLAKRAEDADEVGEDIRRLYVAATRHRDHLVFVAADWRTKEGELREGGSYLRRMDDVLKIAGAAEGAGRIAYGGKFTADVRIVAPTAPRAGAGKAPLGRKLLAEAQSGTDLARRIVKSTTSAAGELPLLGPLPAELGQAELAVTALVDFGHCPMLYRWRYELRVPGTVPSSAENGDRHPLGKPVPTFDAATLGTLYHRCMELLDFAQRQGPRALLTQALGEMELEDAPNVDALASELGQMLEAFRARPLWKQLAGAAQAYRELDFVMALGPAVLRGQIDLLYQDAAGSWRIVDYKSDRVSAEDVAAHAERYELQMLLYAAAAGRSLGPGGRPADATLYFLRPAREHVFKLDAKKVAAAEARAAGLARKLISCRRSGVFPQVHGARCDFCPYGSLCENSGLPRRDR